MSKFVNPKIQAINLIQHIGDIVSQTGTPIDKYSANPEDIGAPSQDFLNDLIEELINKGLIKVADIDGGYSGNKYFLFTN